MKTTDRSPADGLSRRNGATPAAKYHVDAAPIRRAKADGPQQQSLCPPRHRGISRSAEPFGVKWSSSR